MESKRSPGVTEADRLNLFSLFTITQKVLTNTSGPTGNTARIKALPPPELRTTSCYDAPKVSLYRFETDSKIKRIGSSQ